MINNSNHTIALQKQQSANRLVAKLCLVVALFVMNQTSFAQDPTFSQYNLNQYYYNPAYTGNHGGYQVAATYRTLWPNVPGKVSTGPLSAYDVIADAYIKAGNSYTAGAGLFVMQNVQGEGYLTTTTAGISYAQHFMKISASKDALPRFQLSIGFKAYFNSISLNWDKLVFSDQLNLFQPNAAQSAADHNGIARKFNGDLDLGLLVKHNFKGKDKWYNEFGFAIAHILSPSNSLTGSVGSIGRTPRKYIATYRSSIGLDTKRFYIGPTILFENQGPFYELNTGIDLFINPKRNASIIPFCISVIHRLAVQHSATNTNALIAAVRYKGGIGDKFKVVYNIGFAVDLPYSGLAMQTKGAYEISLSLLFPRKNNDNFSKCPF